MPRTLLKSLLSLCLLPLATMAVEPWVPGLSPRTWGDANLAGEWALDPDRSSALDGWTSAKLRIQIDGSKIHIRHDMTWHATNSTATNTVDLAQPIDVTNFFRIDQRHMAVYARPQEATHVVATRMDGGRTLRIEAQVPLETSQGNTTMRIYQEYRILEGSGELVLIELHSTRDRPLVYHFTRVWIFSGERPPEKK